jgi:hypothetical protein
MHPQMAHALHEARVHDMRRRRPVADRIAGRPRGPRPRFDRRLRRTVGRVFIRIGQAIAAEPRQPVASR